MPTRIRDISQRRACKRSLESWTWSPSPISWRVKGEGTALLCCPFTVPPMPIPCQWCSLSNETRYFECGCRLPSPGLQAFSEWPLYALPLVVHRRLICFPQLRKGKMLLAGCLCLAEKTVHALLTSWWYGFSKPPAALGTFLSATG